MIEQTNIMVNIQLCCMLHCYTSEFCFTITWMCICSLCCNTFRLFVCNCMHYLQTIFETIYLLLRKYIIDQQQKQLSYAEISCSHEIDVGVIINSCPVCGDECHSHWMNVRMVLASLDNWSLSGGTKCVVDKTIRTINKSTNGDCTVSTIFFTHHCLGWWIHSQTNTHIPTHTHNDRLDKEAE